MSDNALPVADRINGTPPPRSKPVWVQCENFRCLARQDDGGRWRSVFGDNELTTFVSVIESAEDS